MSEYQYYEFQAIDRRLTAAEMAELRSFSTRARITSTSFVNDYEWGAFKGDEDAWMDKYFDAFLYFANWGTHILKLRLPSRLLDRGTAKPYCVGNSVSVRERGGKTTIGFTSDDEAEEWSDQTDALSALTPIRTQLGRGDLRSLYLGWLLCAQTGEIEESDLEPPVPPGLRELDGSLERLVEFLRIDTDLLDVAARASVPMQVQSLTRKAIRKWITDQTSARKDEYLERFIADEDPALAAELQRMIGNRYDTLASFRSRRTAGALLEAAQQAADERQRAEAERARIEKLRRERKTAQTRAKYLAEIAKKEPAVWAEIGSLIATKQPASYDRAIILLVDLRDAAASRGHESRFVNRFESLRLEHARKPSLIARLQRAGLP
jgi:hypothetical protein